ncbi:hypothetical protein PanWU01x14_303650 [Parasponia andersonii]|uniref:Uncharacterized protein n=1 Tax=Parasponia andersonii TaxID=3476 RepID=A0A2P5ASV6_PARAD|nr:hypothetical protein PanWU01x14_303650 [Parasponia andersonii]
MEILTKTSKGLRATETDIKTERALLVHGDLVGRESGNDVDEQGGDGQCKLDGDRLQSGLCKKGGEGKGEAKGENLCGGMSIRRRATIG